MANTSDKLSPRSLASQLQRLAERATFAHHATSPVVDAIAAAPSAHPFVDVVRALVLTLKADPRGVPDGSIVTRLVSESDLDASEKLWLLRQLLVCQEPLLWESEREPLARREGSVIGSILTVLRDGGKEARDALKRWLDDARRGPTPDASFLHVAVSYLFACAAAEAEAVDDAASAVELLHARGRERFEGADPRSLVAFARRAAQEGALLTAIVALETLEGSEGVEAEVRELAMAIASDSAAGLRQEYWRHWHVWTAFRLLLALPTVDPIVWTWVERHPQENATSLAAGLGRRLRNDCLRPIEVIEHWMWKREGLLEAVTCGLRACFSLRRDPPGHVSLCLELQRRLIADLKEAWQRGARAFDVALALVCALYDRTDEECSTLGLDELALSLAPILECQEPLMQAAMDRSSWGTLWATRIIDRVMTYADAEDRERYVYWFEHGKDAPDAWASGAIRRLRAVRTVH